jgi:hypothetical protein
MPQERSHYTRAEILTVFITTLVGALICLLFMLWYLNRDSRWIRIASPPGEMPAQIVAVDRQLRVYVRTAAGNVYLCGSSWRDACRAVPAEEVPVVRVPAQWRTCTSTPPDIPAPPGTVVDSLLAGRCLEAATYSEHIITADGGIWQWSRTFSWANQFAGAVCVTLGIVLGLGGGILIVFLRRWIRAG